MEVLMKNYEDEMKKPITGQYIYMRLLFIVIYNFHIFFIIRFGLRESYDYYVDSGTVYI